MKLVIVQCVGVPKSWLASIFVAMFLHGGLLHIGGNMPFLWIFRNNVDDRLGHLVYPIFYVMGGLAAAGLSLAFGPDSTIPSLGASGAIGSILGAYLVAWRSIGEGEQTANCVWDSPRPGNTTK